MLNISKKEHIDGNQIGVLLKSLPNDGSKGARLYDWQLLPTSGEAPEGFKRVKAYLAFAPLDAPDRKLVEVAHTPLDRRNLLQGEQRRGGA